MISWDVVWAVTLLCLAVLILVFWKVLFYTSSEMSEKFQNDNGIRQCPYCTLIFEPSFHRPVPICPRCHSYLNPKDAP